MLASGALATSRSKDSGGIGWGCFWGTLTDGNFGTAGMIFCPTAQARAVCKKEPGLDGARHHALALVARLLPQPGGELGDGPLVDGPDPLGRADPLEEVQHVGVNLPGRRPQRGHVLLLEQLAEALPGHAGGFLVLAVVQLVLQVRPRLLGLVGVVGLRGPALAPPGAGVDPLEHEVLAVLEELDPDVDAVFGHAALLSGNAAGPAPVSRTGQGRAAKEG
jgi:hypothetical protein